MAAKRIRCTCGKIYDSASFVACPDCQTPSPFSTPAEEAPKSEATPPPLPDRLLMVDSDRKKRPWLYAREEHPLLAAFLAQKKIVFGVGLVALVLGVAFFVRPRPEPIPPKPTPAAATQNLPLVENANAAERETPTIPVTPTPVENLPAISPADLAAEIARAKPGATIKLAAGTYRGGFIIDRPLRLIGDSTGGAVVIESENLKSLQIGAADVILENLRFTGNPGNNFAAVKVLDKAVLDLRQCVFDTAAMFAVGAVGTAKLAASGCTFSTSRRGTGIQMEDASRAELTDCIFKDNSWGCTIKQAAQGQAVRCRFERNGLPDQIGYSFGTTGEKVYANLEQCTFTDNPRGIIANEGSHILMKGCTVKNTGITDEPGHTTFGAVNANSGHLLINDCTFDSNKQGVIVQSGGSAKLENCNFTDTGLRKASKALLFYCSAVSASGEGSKVSLFKTNIRKSLQSGVKVVEGASLEMEDCEVSGGISDGLAAGAGGKLHSEVTVVNCRFLSNKLDGISISPDTVVKVSKSTISRNGVTGIFISGENAALVAEECEISNNGECGVLADQAAFPVVAESTIVGNAYGVQAGMAKSKQGVVLFLKSCKIIGNTRFGASAMENGTLHLNDCSFAKNKKDFSKAGGMILQNWSGEKSEIDRRNGMGPGGQSGGMTGVDSSTPAPGPSNSGAKADRPDSPESTPSKRRPPSKNKSAQPESPTKKAEEILNKVLRLIPR